MTKVLQLIACMCSCMSTLHLTFYTQCDKINKCLY